MLLLRQFRRLASTAAATDSHAIALQDHVHSSELRFDPRLLQLKPTKLPPAPRVRDILHVYGLRAKKNLSQNFLLDNGLLAGLVRAAGINPGHRVVEVGAGPGNLTRHILERSPFELIGVEKDRRFLPILEQLADSVLPGQFKILLGDVLNHNFDNAFGNPDQIMKEYQLPDNLPEYFLGFSRAWKDDKPPLIRLIGNLPFSISTILLIRWLELISLQKGFWQYGRVPMLLTFQDEVARRICADPTAYERTRLSAMVQNYCHVDYKFKISGKHFTPIALVDTGVVRVTPRKKPYCQIPFKLYEKFIRHLYHHRNHSIRYNFKTLYPKDMRDATGDCFEQARVNPNLYSYMLGNLEIARLAEQYYDQCLKTPALIEYNYRTSKRLESEQSLKVLEEAGLRLLDD